jgi:FlaA1/EpsC-like NDP-sugar epimerase
MLFPLPGSNYTIPTVSLPEENAMQRLKVLVTGASGVFGREITERLVRRGP